MFREPILFLMAIKLRRFNTKLYSLCYLMHYPLKTKKPIIMYKTLIISLLCSWELTGSNRRPSVCKTDALNQLS
jgi:hypothetical protein